MGRWRLYISLTAASADARRRAVTSGLVTSEIVLGIENVATHRALVLALRLASGHAVTRLRS